MQTQNEIVDIIVRMISPLEHVEKIIFSADYLVNGFPYAITLIIYENTKPNYIVTQQEYELLLKAINGSVQINLLAISTEHVTTTLDYRLQDFLTIYEKKEAQ